MNELIKITTNAQGSQVVSARGLHEFLEVKGDFSTWCKRMFDYGFEEEKDFTSILGKSTGGRPTIDYALTLDTAKEIAMLQRSDKGKQARQYFIECERALKEQKPTLTREQVIAQALLLAQEVNAEKDEIIKKLTPKAEFTDKVLISKTCHTVTEIAKELNMSAQKLNAELCKKGVQYKHRGHYVLYAKYQDKGYTQTETYPFVNSSGETQTKIQTVWTERGRAWIHFIFNEKLMLN